MCQKLMKGVSAMFFGKKPKPQTVAEEPAAPVWNKAPEEEQSPSREPEDVKEPVETEVPEPEPAHSQEDVGDGSMNESDLTASVSRNTVFKGDISTQDNLDVYGTVEGSVTSSAVVRIYGTVHGDIACGVLVANQSEIIGDILAEKSVVIGKGTTVAGDIHAVSVSISGLVDGDITATESAVIGSESRVSGDITTAELEMSKGAIVNGGLKMEQAPRAIPPEEPEAPEPADEPEQASEAAQAVPDAFSYMEEEELVPEEDDTAASLL